jgi:hypothetical protein
MEFSTNDCAWSNMVFVDSKSKRRLKRNMYMRVVTNRLIFKVATKNTKAT